MFLLDGLSIEYEPFVTLVHSIGLIVNHTWLLVDSPSLLSNGSNGKNCGGFFTKMPCKGTSMVG